jgi:hypothetical protein
MIHPDTRLQLIDDRIGNGVVAARHIPKGTVIWMRDALDQVFERDRLAALPPILRFQLELYSYVDLDGTLILPWDHGRQVNHSCEPTTTTIGNFLEVANRDLAPGDEITCEYGIGFFTIPFDCTCGASRCRKDSRAMPTEADFRRWDAEAADVYAHALTVDQPVLESMTEGQPGAWILKAIRERRRVTLPSWVRGATAADWHDGPSGH